MNPSDAFPELYRDLTESLDREHKAATLAYMKEKYGRTGAAVRKDVAAAVVQLCCERCALMKSSVATPGDIEESAIMWAELKADDEKLREKRSNSNKPISSAIGALRKHLPAEHPLRDMLGTVHLVLEDDLIFSDKKQGTRAPTALIRELGDLLQRAGIERPMSRYIVPLLDHYSLRRGIQSEYRKLRRTGAFTTTSKVAVAGSDEPTLVTPRAIDQALARHFRKSQPT